ncbi:hypothetical protein KPH14_009305 [Odynerus spinipes]|uniref:Uncharacterized protein n=1 Tax=Odynerus spinipes TaxID=1348599 RepID=A0AAD9RPD4_9HYME|nr:hypothetical protein KPH14_009305 [Odynerus spinipes]
MDAIDRRRELTMPFDDVCGMQNAGTFENRGRESVVEAHTRPGSIFCTGSWDIALDGVNRGSGNATGITTTTTDSAAVGITPTGDRSGGWW